MNLFKTLSLAFVFGLALTVTGCGVDSLTGAEIDAVTQLNGGSGTSTDQSGDHNEGNVNGGSGTSTDQSGDHNEGTLSSFNGGSGTSTDQSGDHNEGPCPDGTNPDGTCK